MAFSHVQAQHQIANVFRKFRNDEGVKHLNLSGDVTRMLQNKEKSLNSTIEEMHVYIFSKNTNMSNNDRQKITKFLNDLKYDLLMQQKDKSSRISIHGIEKDGFLTDVYAELWFENVPIYLILKGKIILGELSKMNFDFEGSNLMKNIPLP